MLYLVSFRSGGWFKSCPLSPGGEREYTGYTLIARCN